MIGNFTDNLLWKNTTALSGKSRKIKQKSIIFTNSHTIPDMKKAINKHWDILEINRDFEEVFTEPPIFEGFEKT